MHYADLRDWIQKVDELGELRRVDGADWYLEMGAITEVYARNEPYPAILFDKVKDLIRRAWSGPLDPIIPRDQKGFSSRAVIDATRPYEWLKDFPFASAASPELKKQVAEKYGKYFS